MVVLRSSGGGVVLQPVATTPDRRSMELDTSSEFLSLVPALQRKSPRSTRTSRTLDDSLASPEHNRVNGDGKQQSGSCLHYFTKTRGQRVKLEVSFSDMEPKAGGYATRKSSRLQKEGKSSCDKLQGDVPDEVEGTSTPKRSRVNLRSPEDEEEHSLRRSSRITQHKFNSRNQSVLYDRLITNTAEAVLQKMDDMKKLRRRLNNEEQLGVYTRGRVRQSLKTNVDKKNAKENQGDHDEEDEDEDDDDDDDEEEEEDIEDDIDDDEDAVDEEDNQRRYDFRQRKNVVLYQAPQDEPREARETRVPRKRTMYFKDHSSPTRHRFPFSSTAPRSPYNRRRTNRRRHALHSSDSTSTSSEDETFQRRRRKSKSKSRSRSVTRCLPMNIVKDDLLGIHKDRIKTGASLADVDPMNIDKTVRFDSIGGLSKHISSLKEMVVFPLLYPEVFERFHIQPPRGCLFYGPPGTGKTLVARALANECSQGERKVSFFMRKGADCLSKWVGESERQLRLLFDQAYQMRPSIIFFDEIDGLAPVRSSRQDQIHSSIVSTLLALMDGLDGRGEIVVIGATNRLDSIDPALRRPGRFDREFLFGLPDREARRDILKIHTKQWTPQLSENFLEELGDKCVGYCGADIKAVCSEAALCALRRRYPQIYSSSEKLVLDVDSIAITAKDFMSAMSKMVPAAQRAVVSPAKALMPAIRPLLSAALQEILHTVRKVFPHAEQGFKRKRTPGQCCVSDDELMFSEDEERSSGQTPQKKTLSRGILNIERSALSQPTSYRPRVLLEGRHGSGQTSHLAPAVLHALEKFTVYTLDMAVVFGTSAIAPEEACAQIFVEAKRTSPSVLYVPHIGQWWETVGPALKATFLSLLGSLPAFAPILLLATCSLQYSELSFEVQELFKVEYGEVYHVQAPCSRERRNFFEDLMLNQAAKAPASKNKYLSHSLEVLPVAPPLPPRQLAEQEARKLAEQEEDSLRELRLFLRDVTNRLSQDKRFKAFTKPVDLEEVPDYAAVIKKPMDLSTVLSNIDLHQYITVKDFLQDVDLIWQNALEYNPDKDPSDRQIRHRACALKDTVHAIIRHELDENFEKICDEIKDSRINRGCSTAQYAPSFYHVLPKQAKLMTEANMADKTPQRELAKATTALTPSTTSSTCITPKSMVQRKKRRRSRWASGFYSKKTSSSSPQISKECMHLVSDNDDDDADEETEMEKGMITELDEDEDKEVESVVKATVKDSTQSESEKRGAEDQAPNEIETVDKHQPAVEFTADNPVNVGRSTTSIEGHNQGQLDTGCGQTCTQNLTREANSEIAGQKPKPVEVVTDSTSTDHSEALRGDKDSCPERNMRRMTRPSKNTAQQQQFDMEKVLQIRDQENPSLVVDRDKLKELLDKVVTKTDGCEVHKLEKLYALLCQSVYRHRRDHHKAALIRELEQEINDFC
ncbi:ATPase family AAA domain-containing protein 2-like isoform X2 [Phycodurus eques]|uniref:ATPase family AAA domain-containing protein 2-like isoform X2 n=1 Tax=Phycodurus eques TaxID=693459 RepID=UPI002ACD4FFC|nr:ATPase family AAA domain-containing protein 2-like isoform X2 [Phycodurus eques]